MNGQKKLLYVVPVALLLLLFSVGAVGAPIDEVRRLYAAGDFAGALERVLPLLRKSPRDAAYNYYAGACRVELGETSLGIQNLKTAVKRGSGDAALLLAEKSVTDYLVDEAEEYLSEYDAIISKKSRQKPDTDRLDEINSRLTLTRNMLDRIEKIAVIDSINVPRADFFRYYRLSPEAGRLIPGSMLQPGTSEVMPEMIYVPENEIELLWATPDSTGTYVLMSADRLADGSMTQPQVLGGNLNEGGDVDFPFMMPDGVTLYYACNGDNSIGGYDIFMTRRDGDGFLQPQNVGMPYNSPYDDYMLAIDEVTGIGWWATDRNQIPDSVTIYVYIPNEMRSNYPSGAADVIPLAKLTSIAATQIPGVDYGKFRKRIASIDTQSRDADTGGAFRFAIPGKGIYTRPEQFRSPQARILMETYLKKADEYARSARHLRLLRKAYADGNHGVADEIRRLETLLEGAEADLMRASNAVIKAER